MPAKQDQPPAPSEPAKSGRELLGLARGADLFDENGELNEAAVNAFAEELNRQLRQRVGQRTRRKSGQG